MPKRHLLYYKNMNCQSLLLHKGTFISILSLLIVLAFAFNFYAHDILSHQEYLFHQSHFTNLHSSPVQPEPEKLSILILTFNKSDVLARLLYELKKSKIMSTVEVILVDNGCYQDTVEVVLDYQHQLKDQQNELTTKNFYSFRYLPFCNNTQYAAAYNLAFTQISPYTTWVLLLNDDIIPRQNFLRNFLTFAQFSDILGLSTGAIGCKLLFPNHKIVEAGSVIRADASTDNFLRYKYTNSFSSSSSFLLFHYPHPIFISSKRPSPPSPSIVEMVTLAMFKCATVAISTTHQLLVCLLR